MEHVYIEYGGDSIALPIGESVLGRDAGCMFRLNDPAVSRRHARLIHRQHEVFVEDLGSANGTLLNGRTVAAPIRIHHGDVISIGSRKLKVCFTNPLDDDTSTVRVSSLAHAAARVDAARVGRRTHEMPAIVPPLLTANERCPRCSAVVSAAEQACGNCHYRWGSAPLGSATSLNRRRSERCSVELRAAYASTIQQLDATTLDVSENGVFVCTQSFDAIGTPCSLTIFVDGGPSLVVSGIVRRVVEPGTTHPALVGMGIELTELGINERAWLAALVHRLAAEA